MTYLTSPLTLLEVRVLGTLAEKQHTVPDTYPLSLNALAAGCNQKTSRSPVMDVREADIFLAIDVLKGIGLVSEIGGGRVVRFEHHLGKVLGIRIQMAALMTVLMLRGPQTAGELRLNCERLYKFADISSVETFLEEMAARAENPLVVELPRLPGSRENRWMHLLSGQPAHEVPAEGKMTSSHSANQEMDELKARVAVLEAEVAALKAGIAPFLV